MNGYFPKMNIQMAGMCMKMELDIPNHHGNVIQTAMQQTPHIYRTAITKT